jgi:hypothetical protein
MSQGLARIGLDAKARMYTIGNPLIARTMIQHDLGVGLNVPIRLMIFEHAESEAGPAGRIDEDQRECLADGFQDIRDGLFELGVHERRRSN